MKKLLTGLLTLMFLFALSAALVGAADADELLSLPPSLEEIAAEAFAGDTSLTAVVIPGSVQHIRDLAFADCSSLRDVYFENSSQTDIAADAFQGCEDACFHVYAGTAVELYALGHGFSCEIMDGDSFFPRMMSLVNTQHAERTGGWFGSSASFGLQSGEFSSNRLFVRMREDRLPDISEFSPVGIVRWDEYHVFVVQFSTTVDTIDCYYALENRADVLYVEPDQFVGLYDGEDEIGAAGYVSQSSWGLTDPLGFDAYASFVAAHSSRRVIVAVVDSGVEPNPAYNAILSPRAYSVTGSPSDWAIDKVRHGSMIAGLIRDCAGTANIELLPVGVMFNNGEMTISSIATGIKYALENGAEVINLSLSCPANETISLLLQEAVDTGVSVVVAAGNDSRRIDNVFPANQPGMITVSGIDSSYQLSSKSNYGANVQYCAPDTDVISSAYPNQPRNATSFAAPMLSAAIALVKADRYHTEEDLQASCMQLEDAVQGQNNYGHGLPQLELLAGVPAETIRLDSGTPDVLAVGQSCALLWHVSPDEATDTGASGSSDRQDVLSVTESEGGGLTITGVSPGTAVLTLRSKNTLPGKTVQDTKTITVVQPVTSLRISAGQRKLKVSDSIPLRLEEILPENAADLRYRWRVTSLGGEATIDGDGNLSAVSPGSVAVEAVAEDGFGAVSNRLLFEIEERQADQVTLYAENGWDISEGSIALALGTVLPLRADVVTEGPSTQVTWNCPADAESILTVDQEGRVQAQGPGSAEVTATSVNGSTCSLLVTVLPYEVLENEDGSLTLTAYLGEDEELSVPARLNGAVLTAIGDHAFASRKSLLTVEFPDTVASIGEYAFYNCSNLTQIRLPEGLVCASAHMFDECVNLMEIELPNGLETIGDYCFYRSGIQSLVIPGSVKTLGERAFSYSRLQEVVLPEGLEAIPSFCFNASALQSITIPDSVKSLGNCAFFYCSSLTQAALPNGLETIPESCFARSGLTGIVIPESVKIISTLAFYNCDNLKAIVIPAGVRSIGSEALNSTALNTITFLGSDTEIANYATSHVNPDLMIHGETGSTAHAYAKQWEIAFYAEKVNVYLWVNREAEEDVNYSYGSRLYSTEDTLYITPGMTLRLWSFQNDLSSHVEPDMTWDCGSSGAGVLSHTEPCAFQAIGVGTARISAIPAHGVEKTLTVTIVPYTTTGHSIVKYERSQYSLNETEITVPDMIDEDTVREITGYYYSSSDIRGAFEGTSGLRKITLPNSITLIGKEAFRTCTSLETVNCPEALEKIDDSAFRTCKKLQAFELVPGVNRIGNYAFADCESLSSMDIPDSVEWMGQGAFSGCSGLTELTLSASALIPDDAFSGCTGLKTVTLPRSEAVYRIGNRAFSGCTGLTRIYIPDTVTSIGAAVFKDHDPRLILFCMPGSYAEQYAKRNDLFYVTLDNWVE